MFFFVPFCGFTESFLVKIYQFHRRHGGFKSLVPQFHAGAIDSLIDRVGRDDAEYYRKSGGQCCMRNSVRHFARDVIEMRSLTTDNSTETNDCIKLT